MSLFFLTTLLIFANSSSALPVEATATTTTPCTHNLPITTSIIPPPTFTFAFTFAPLPTFTLSSNAGEYEAPETIETPSTTISNENDKEMTVRAWINPATYTLLCYDVVVGVVFVWCWLSGWFWWWWRKEDGGGGLQRGEGVYAMEEWNRGRGGERNRRDVEGQMRRLGMI